MQKFRGTVNIKAFIAAINRVMVNIPQLTQHYTELKIRTATGNRGPCAESLS
jgi:hypothetical protein